MGDDETVHSINQNTARRNRCYLCRSGYQLLSKCLGCSSLGTKAASASRVFDRAPYLCRIRACPCERISKDFSTASDLSGQFAVLDADSVLALGAVGTADLVCFK